MPFFVRGGLENATYLYVGVSKMHFYVCVGLKTSFFGMWGLEIQFFVCGGPENAIFCGSLKNAFSCKWGSRKFRFFVCGVWKMPFLYVGVWKMPFFISGDLEKYFYVEVSKIPFLVYGVSKMPFWYVGVSKMPCPPSLMSTGDSHKNALMN